MRTKGRMVQEKLRLIKRVPFFNFKTHNRHKLENKANIITGASMGLGLAAAKELASQGADLATVGLQRKKLDDV